MSEDIEKELEVKNCVVLSRNYRMCRSDSANLVLQERVQKEERTGTGKGNKGVPTGKYKEVWVTVGYYGTVQQVLQGLVNKVGLADKGKIEDWLADLKEARAAIAKVTATM